MKTAVDDLRADLNKGKYVIAYALTLTLIEASQQGSAAMRRPIACSCIAIRGDYGHGQRKRYTVPICLRMELNQ
jgi:hypothetical protein